MISPGKFPLKITIAISSHPSKRNGGNDRKNAGKKISGKINTNSSMGPRSISYFIFNKP
jgi:hypothetical protein